MDLNQLFQTGRTIRAIGFDDAHCGDKAARGTPVNVAGVVCGGTRFEGMVWDQIAKDGMDAGDRIADRLLESKFMPQLHLALLDGITFGGCNVVDLPALHQQIQIPIVALMRRHPDLEQFRHVTTLFPDAEERWRRTQAAGTIYQIDQWTFQCVGEDPKTVAKVLGRLTDVGKVPEALRLAHLIGSAVMLGQSTNRA